MFDAPLEVLTGLESRQTEGRRADRTGAGGKGESRTNDRRRVSEITNTGRGWFLQYFSFPKKSKLILICREISRFQIGLELK